MDRLMRSRLKPLEREIEGERMTLVCPECSEEFVVYGDVAVEYIVWEWSRESGHKEGHHKMPEGTQRAFEHEHDPGAFVEETSGLPFLSREVSGMNLGGVAHDA
jgi:hypothetical protein